MLHIRKGSTLTILCGSTHNICNEEGKIKNLPFSRAIHTQDGKIQDIIAGDFLIVSADSYSGEFKSLSPQQIKKYKELFKYPEKYASVNGEIVAIPYKPKEKDKER